jgi:ATP-dependent Clp protease adaptor protein ClpS
MGDELLTLFGLAWAVVFGTAVFPHVKAAFTNKRREDVEMDVVVRAALADAHLRGQFRVDLAHFALALTFDAEVSARLTKIAPLATLRDRLDEVIEALEPVEKDPRFEDEEVRRRIDPEMQSALAGRSGKGPSPSQAMGALIARLGDPVDPSPHVRDVFDGLHIDLFAWQAAGRDAKVMRAEVPPLSSPYRAPSDATPRGDHHVRLWNDAQTTQAFVVALLTELFALSRAEAAYTMMRIDRVGSALLGPFTRDEAARLVAKAEERARSEGHPLRVTSEVVAAPASSFFGRWFSRSRMS